MKHHCFKFCNKKVVYKCCFSYSGRKGMIKYCITYRNMSWIVETIIITFLQTFQAPFWFWTECPIYRCGWRDEVNKSRPHWWLSSGTTYLCWHWIEVWTVFTKISDSIIVKAKKQQHAGWHLNTVHLAYIGPWKVTNQ